MRKAILLYNPDSGGSGRRRLAELESALAVLRGGGVEATLIPTDSKSHARQLTQDAINSGCDTIFACGGDGTINNVIQVIANSPVALAILPMGTANALAYDIGLPLNVAAAAKAALTAKHKRVAVGRVEYTNLEGKPGSRYFIVAAGVGVDAHLFYKLQNSAKQRMGMTAYYVKAWNLWFTYPMTRFLIEYLENGSNERKQADITELLGVRIRNFGGVVQELAPGASLDHNDVRLVFARTASRAAYLAYVMRGILRQRWAIPGIDLVSSTKVACRYKPGSSASESHRKIYVEADGDLLGTLPAEISIVPDALTILAPSR
jgi:YegS/Rv2252/BmrU family lipid kinase